MIRSVRMVVLILVFAISGMVGRPDVSRAQDATPAASASPFPASGIALLLPTLQQVPPGLEITDDRERSLDEVTANFSDPARAREQFIDWGWQRNVIRAFHTPTGAPAAPEKIDGIYVSIHEFGTPEFAAAALDYSFGVQATDTRLAEIAIDPLGDTSRALSGTVAYGNEVTIYVQRGTALIRLSASSPTGDPKVQAIDLMTTMLGS